MVLFVQKPYVAAKHFSFCPLLPRVVILLSSGRSVSANNWVTLMGHDMCGARLLPCCSSDAARRGGERKKKNLLVPPSLPFINPHPSINDPPAPFTRSGLLWKVIGRVGGRAWALQRRRVTRSAALFSSVSLRDACGARVYCCASPPLW